jgi:signal transduction histidine kinase/CheY-like chemotaxis protein
MPLAPPDLTELQNLPQERLIERARALATVLHITDAIASATDLDDMAQAAVAAVARHTGYQAVLLFRYDDRAKTFNALGWHGIDASRYPTVGVRLPAERSLTGLSTSLRDIVTTAELRDDPRIERSVQKHLVADGFSAGVSVPLLYRDEVVGALNLLSPETRGLTADEREILWAIGRTLAVAMAQHLARQEQRALEEQARRAQQLESLGVLAGGIAHDFNNLLMGILGNLELATQELRPLGLTDALDILTDAHAAAVRARGLVRQLLTFAVGSAPLKHRTADIGGLVRDAARFALHGTSAECVFDLGVDLGVVSVDAVQIAQVVQNLVLNAAQASARGTPIAVRLFRRTLAAPEPPVPAGNWLCLAVEDHGKGIEPANLERIFEPFFTTRQGGTGLGLSVTHSIVRGHGGHIQVVSRVDAGTTFTVYLPAEVRKGDLTPAPERDPVRHDGFALVMDDEPAVLRVATQMLEKLGYAVHAATTGDEAVALVRATEGASYSLALLDVTIVGGRGGYEVLDELRQLAPHVPVIMTSGYAERASASPARARPHATLAKPYTLQELGRAVQLARAAAR